MEFIARQSLIALGKYFIWNLAPANIEIAHMFKIDFSIDFYENMFYAENNKKKLYIFYIKEVKS